MSATLGVGGAIGLPLSAWIAEDHDWHALFWLSAVLALLILLATLDAGPARPGRQPRPARPRRRRRARRSGWSPSWSASPRPPTWGWGDARTLGAIVGGLVVLLLWGAYEWRQTDPLVDLRTTAQLPVLLTNVAAVAIGFGMMAQSIVVPQLLQLPSATGYGLGQSILAAGLWMAPAGLMMMLFAPVSSGLMRRFGAKLTLMTGATVLGAGYLVALVLMDAPWQLLVASCVASAGVGIGYAAMPTLILDAVPPREAGSAVGVNALMRSMGTTLAAAVMGTILSGSATRSGGSTCPARAPSRSASWSGRPRRSSASRSSAAPASPPRSRWLERRGVRSGVVRAVDRVVERAQALEHRRGPLGAEVLEGEGDQLGAQPPVVGVRRPPGLRRAHRLARAPCSSYRSTRPFFSAEFTCRLIVDWSSWSSSASSRSVSGPRSSRRHRIRKAEFSSSDPHVVARRPLIRSSSSPSARSRASSTPGSSRTSPASGEATVRAAR